MIVNVLIYMFTYFICYLNIKYLLNKKIRFIYFFIGLIFFPLSCFINNSFRILYYFIILCTIFLESFKDLKKVSLAIIFNYFIFIINDILVLVLAKLCGIDTNYYFILNLLISMLSYFEIRLKTISRIWKFICERFEFVLIFTIILMLIYIKFSLTNNSLNSIFLIVLFVITIVALLRETSLKYIELKERENSLKYLKIFDEYVENLRMHQHERINTLLCIKGMVVHDKNIIEFIDNVVANENSIDSSILKDVMGVKLKMIRGLLYQKLIYCKDNNIDYVINTEDNINFDLIDYNTNTEIVLILGILLDNAIEACKNIKDKNLSIYIYQENNDIIFQVSNTFSGNINLNLLFNKGYSTKGDNRGYGLSIVKEKIKGNINLNLKTEIHGDIFIQKLFVSLTNQEHVL